MTLNDSWKDFFKSIVCIQEGNEVAIEKKEFGVLEWW